MCLESILSDILYCLDYKMHPLQCGRKMGVRFILQMYLTFTLVKYHVIYVIKYFTTFLLQNFFSYFPPLKARCVFWSEKYGTSFPPNNLRGRVLAKIPKSLSGFSPQKFKLLGDLRWAVKTQMGYLWGDPGNIGGARKRTDFFLPLLPPLEVDTKAWGMGDGKRKMERVRWILGLGDPGLVLWQHWTSLLDTWK